MRPLVLYLIGIYLFSGCVTTPETGRRAFILTSEAEEAQLGRQAYSEVLRKERVSTNARAKELLVRVGRRIAEATRNANYQWEFNLSVLPARRKGRRLYGHSTGGAKRGGARDGFGS
jgi:hypothetical protein